MIEQLKECTGCHKSQPLTNFNDSANGRDFKKSICKKCESNYNKGYYESRKKLMKDKQNAQTQSIAQA